MTNEEARNLANFLYSMNATIPTKAADAIIDLVEQLEYYTECETISDSKLQILKGYCENWKEDALAYQEECELLRGANESLKKKVAMLKQALYNDK